MSTPSPASAQASSPDLEKKLDGKVEDITVEISPFENSGKDGDAFPEGGSWGWAAVAGA